MTRTVGNPVIATINAVALGLAMYAFNYLFSEIDLPPHLESGGHWQFLTNLSLLFSVIIFGLGVAAHVLKSTTLFHVKNSLHPIALVLESVVASVYWPLRLVFLGLLTKNPSKYLVPMRVDLCLHLVPVATLMVDYLVFMPKWTIRTETALGTVVLLTTLYWFLLKHLIDFENGGEYPYMFLNVDTEEMRILIFGMVGLIGFVLYLINKRIHDLIVVPDAKEKKKLQ